MKHIGFLSFGHWTPSPQSQTRSAMTMRATVHQADARLGADLAIIRDYLARQ